MVNLINNNVTRIHVYAYSKIFLVLKNFNDIKGFKSFCCEYNTNIVYCDLIYIRMFKKIYLKAIKLCIFFTILFLYIQI